jgi:hypothetical protein
MTKTTLALTLTLGSMVLARSVLASDALVYKGPGSCDEGCSDAAALMAQKAGLNPVFVGPTEADSGVFKNAVVWIQPGGASRVVGQNMTEQLKGWIRDFVMSGGGYVGFCAGGFYATPKIGELQDPGLGLIPGASQLYREVPDGAEVLKIQWNGQARSLYWEGGPFFKVPATAVSDGTAEIIASYPDGTTASVRASYGLGRAYVTGLHPEAPQFWRNYFQLADPDGLDYDLAVDMIQWAKKR